MANPKERLHMLVEHLADEDVAAAERLLAELATSKEDPLLRALLRAPMDDEPVTDEDLAAIAESGADIAAGRLISHAEARRRLLDA